MAEEKKELWLSYLALTTVVLAVCATLSTFKGGSYSTRSVMFQTQASDQWAFYQAKSIKGYLYDIQREMLELELRERSDSSPPSLLEGHKNQIASFAGKVAKYEDEKKQIQEAAKKLEASRDDAQKHQQIFGMAVIFLQISILLSSIAALLKKKSFWLMGLAVGLVGVVYFANGFLLFM
ncbi:MAG: DUF4337 domain-containing protein [Candidatus Riflebacteria bacterium]|nr:DUF4337 domain-containing protein [Candidatus Riflebacteria bacterium]